MPCACGSLILAFLLASFAAAAETPLGRVVRIADGDSLTVLVGQRQVKVGINGIDAPEKGQPFAEQSKENLSAMAFRNDARLECHKKDQYGRHVCKVWVQPSDCPSCGQTLDVGHAQIISGMAWWFRKYIREQTLEDRGRYQLIDASKRRAARATPWSIGRTRRQQENPPKRFSRDLVKLYVPAPAVSRHHGQQTET